MEVFLSEHGQTIQYAVIGVIIVALISIITNTSIKKILLCWKSYYKSNRWNRFCGEKRRICFDYWKVRKW